MFFRIWLLLQEFWHDLKTQKTRAFLTTFSVAWGTLSVILLLAFGEGLEHQMVNGQLNNGDRIIRVFGGTTSIVYQGLPKGRDIRLRPEDAELLATSIPEIDLTSPAYGRRVPVNYNGTSTTAGYTIGANPAFETLRRMFPVAGGRFLNDDDVAQKRRVVFLGNEIAERLFGDKNPIGEQIDIGGFPFKVIGVMPHKFQNSMSNGPDNLRVVIPYTTFQSIWPRRGVWYLAIKPRNAKENLLVRARVSEVLGRKYRFAGTDDRAVSYWDQIENEEMMRKIFRGIQIFMAVVGGMTLFIAGVGIANIMYVVVKERTREIGIKRAIGAKRRHIVAAFMIESFLVTGIGGVLGTIGALVIIALVSALPLEESQATEMLGTPNFSPEIAIFTVLVLVSIGLFAGIYPARRASRIEPVEALRYE
jgi:putative ABC transport system permease protein